MTLFIALLLSLALTPNATLLWDDLVIPPTDTSKATGYRVCSDSAIIPSGCMDVGLPGQTANADGITVTFQVKLSDVPALTIPGAHTVSVIAYAPDSTGTMLQFSPESVRVPFMLESSGTTVTPPTNVVINDPTCVAPLGSNAPSITITSLTKTTGKAGSKSRLNYQLASSKSPIVSVIVRVDGVDTGYRLAGANLTSDGGIWFTTPDSGTHMIGLKVQNGYGCELIRTYGQLLVVP